MELIQDILRLVKKNVCRTAPFLYQVCTMTSFIPIERFHAEGRDGKSILSTDGIDIYYEPEGIMKLYKERKLIQLEKELLHILLHGMLGHFEMWKGMDNQELFDLCADVEVEQLMRKLGCKYSQIKENENVCSCREMYIQYLDSIHKGQATVEGIKKMIQIESTDEHQYWKQEQLQDEIQEAWEERKNSLLWNQSLEETERLENLFEYFKYKKGGAECEENDIEDMQGNTLQKVSDTKKGTFNFTEILKEILEVDESMKENEEQFDKGLYSYGFDLYGDVALIEPSEEHEDKKKIDTIVIAIDTSGSCEGDLVERFFREVRKLFVDIQTSYTVDNIVIIQCDDTIQEEITYHSIEHFLNADEITLKGFRGTDFRPVFKRVEQLSKKQKIKSLLYFSDGEGVFPEKEASFQTIFIMDNQNGFRFVPKWVKTYFLNDTEVERC